MILRVLVAALFFHAAAADCMCTPAISVGSLYYVSSAVNEQYNYCIPTNNTCATYFANTNQTLGLNGFVKGDFDDCITLGIVDGNAPEFNVTSANFATTLASYWSASPNITFRFYYSDTCNAMPSAGFSFKNAMGFNVPTTMQMTTTTTTPLPVTATGIPFSPSTANLDLVLTLTASNASVNPNDLKAMLSQMASMLRLTTNRNATSETRVTLQTLTSTGDSGVNPAIWYFDDVASLQSNIQNAITRFSGIPKWTNGLNAFLNSGGYFDTTGEHGARGNAQKVYVIATQDNFAEESNAIGTILGNLAVLDVHMVVLYYGGLALPTKLSALKALNIPNLSFLVFNSSDSNALINNYIARYDKDPTFGCVPQQSDLQVDVSAAPANINFPSQSQSNAKYCNSLNVQYLVYGLPGSVLCFKIENYQLETDKDWLVVQDSNGNAIAEFTGIDVKESQFIVNTENATVTFKSNENYILHGFSLKVSTGESC